MARPTDPETSTAAAQSLPLAALSPLQVRVLDQHYQHRTTGLIDEELCDLLRDQHPPTVIKRRTELVKAARLRDTGQRRQTRRNRAAVVWGYA
jgi:hypothetical protein